jgi:hypothetical protein
MIWNDVLDRLRESGLQPVEETYMEDYGKVLSADQPEFRDRHLRCAFGAVRCCGLRIETLLFPSESQLQEFVEIMGPDPWWIPHANVIFHFPESDSETIDAIVRAISQTK